jgi:hypothetical protein
MIRKKTYYTLKKASMTYLEPIFLVVRYLPCLPLVPFLCLPFQVYVVGTPVVAAAVC